jgi:hypothetical protein
VTTEKTRSEAELTRLADRILVILVIAVCAVVAAVCGGIGSAAVSSQGSATCAGRDMSPTDRCEAGCPG